MTDKTLLFILGLLFAFWAYGMFFRYQEEPQCLWARDYTVCQKVIRLERYTPILPSSHGTD